MRRDNVAYLVGGLAFGFVLGYGLFHVVAHRPEKQLAQAGTAGSDAPSPMGPMAPTQVGQNPRAAAGVAPMVAEINGLKRLLQQDPANVQALTRLGNVYQDVGMWKQAIEFYEKVVAIAPQDANLLTDMGACYQGLRDYDKALDLFDRAQKADPSHWQSLYNTVIVAAFDLRRFDAAEAALRKLEKLRPGVAEVDRLRHAVGQARQETAPGS